MLDQNSFKTEREEIKAQHPEWVKQRKEDDEELRRRGLQHDEHKLFILESTSVDGYDWSSIGGCEQAATALQDAIQLPILYPDLFKRGRGSPQKGVLLHGPPGVGKTHIARCLAGACTKAGIETTLFVRRGADILSKWTGEAENLLRELFREARKRAPAIIFFDEIDGIACARGTEQENGPGLVQTLLSLMDGFSRRGEVYVIGATNRLDSVDPALRRPGRFDAEVYVGLPDEASRLQILRIHSKCWKYPPPEETLENIARRCAGYSGADLMAVVEKAGHMALRRSCHQMYCKGVKFTPKDFKKVRIVERDFDDAYEEIMPSVAEGSATCTALNEAHRALFQRSVVTHQKLLRTCLGLEYDDATRKFATERDSHMRPVVVGAAIYVFSPSHGQSDWLPLATDLACEDLPVRIIRIDRVNVLQDWQQKGQGDLLDTAAGYLAELVHRAKAEQPAILYLDDVPWLHDEGLMDGLFMSINHQIGPHDRVLVFASCADVQSYGGLEIHTIFTPDFQFDHSRCQFVFPASTTLGLEDVESYFRVWLQSRFRKLLLHDWDTLAEKSIAKKGTAYKNTMAASDSFAHTIEQKLGKAASNLAQRILAVPRLGLLEDLRAAVRKLEEFLADSAFRNGFRKDVKSAFDHHEGLWTNKVCGSVTGFSSACDRLCNQTNAFATKYNKFIDDLKQIDDL